MVKPIGTKDTKRGVKKGLKPKARKLATTVRKQAKKGKLTANQWQSTPQQNLFMKNWLDPNSKTFGDAYEAAIEAGYSPSYAIQISSPAINNKWIQEFTRKVSFTPEHIQQGIQRLATRAENSKSPDDTRLKAYELLAKLHGLLDNRLQVNQQINIQPILGGKTEPKTVIDAE